MDQHSSLSLPPWKLYLWLVIPATILLNLAFVNFHAPDDYDHVKRAYTLFHHPFRVVTPVDQSSGAMIDSGLQQYIATQRPIAVHERKISEEQWRAYKANGRISWTGQQRFSEMPGAVSYSPLIYAPQSLMLEVGKLSGASVKQSVLLARSANGFVGIALAALGLYLLNSGQSVALLLLLLPRTLLQFASNSADPILYGLALILVAIGVRACEPGRLKHGFAAAAIFLSATVRPPIAALALTPAVQAIRQRYWIGLALLAVACLASVFWWLGIMPSITDRRCGDLGSIGPKFRTFLLEWPMLIGRTFDERWLYYYGSLIGDYTWGDGPGGRLGIPLPIWIYFTAFPLLTLAIWRDLSSEVKLPTVVRLSLLASAICSVVLTFFALYVGCTVPGQSTIGGVQGRYFVPALFALAASVGGLAANRPSSLPKFYQPALILWVVACAATMLVKAPGLYSFSG